MAGLEFLPRKFMNSAISHYRKIISLSIMGRMFGQQNPLALANLVFNHRQLFLCDVPLSNYRVGGSEISFCNVMWVIIYPPLYFPRSKHYGP